MSRHRILLHTLLTVGICFNKCLADEIIPLPQELADFPVQLNAHLCNRQNGCPRPPLTCPSGEPCAFCTQFCSTPPRHCSYDTDEQDELEFLCESSYSQTFVCGYGDAVVCSDELGTCIHKTSDNMVTASFCACKTQAGWEPVRRSGCHTDIPATDSPGLDTVSLVVACCLAVILVILVVALSCCVLRRRWPSFRARSSRSAAPKLEGTCPKVAGPEARHEIPDQQTDERYSYAYGHQFRAAGTSPRAVDETDLDEMQEDHYYSRLKRDGSKVSQSDQGVTKLNACPETGQEEAVKRSGGDESKAEHDYFVLEKVSEPEADGSGERYREPTDQSTGYEVARILHPDDVPQMASSRGSAEAKADQVNRDSGYEIATVNTGEDDKRNSYFTLEPPKENRPQQEDSGYEEVTQAKPQVNEGADESSAYDHLKRPGHDIPTEGAV